jgi:intracellular septation protein A
VLPDAKQLSVASILLGGGPRFARDAFGPLLAFYAGWKLGNLLVGVALATIVSCVAYRYERQRDRTGTIARLAFGFVIIQALIGLLSQSAVVYLAQPVLLNGALGVAFMASVVARRPLAGTFAQEFYPFPDDVRTSKTYRHIFGNVSLTWGLYQCLRSIIRLLVLTSGSVEAFLVVNLITGIPLTGMLLTWSVWYSRRAFQRSEEWGWAFEDEDPTTSPHRSRTQET